MLDYQGRTRKYKAEASFWYTECPSLKHSDELVARRTSRNRPQNIAQTTPLGEANAFPQCFRPEDLLGAPPLSDNRIQWISRTR